MARLLASGVAGALMWQSFATGRGWLAPIALAILYWLLRISRHGRWTHVLTFALVWQGALLSWLRVVGLDAWVLLTLLSSVVWLLLLVVPLKGNRRDAFRLAAAVAAIEWLHSTVPWGGFPWGLLSYSQVDQPLVGWVRVGGDTAVAWAVTCAGVWLYWLVRKPTIGTCALMGVLLLVAHSVGRPAHTGTFIAGVVQGNVPNTSSNELARAQYVLENHLKENSRLALAIKRGEVAQPDVVVWPENASDLDPLLSVARSTALTHAAKQLMAPIWLGALVEDPGAPGPTNSGLLWQPDGSITARYDKQHVVPFGEYLPLRSQLEGRISRLGQISRDIIRGTHMGPIGVAGRTAATLICFEVAFDDRVQDQVRQGAQMMLVQSNNATYARTDQPRQQLQISRLRAFEHARSAVIATTTGESAILDGDGKVVAHAPTLQPAHLVASVTTTAGVTRVDRLGRLPALASIVVFLLMSLRKRSYAHRRRHPDL